MRGTDMTEEDLKEFLEDNKVSIQAAVKSKIIDRLLQEHSWQITQEIRDVVQAFVSAEIVPDVKKYLQDQKGPILEAALVGAAEIGNNLAKAITERSAKNLTSDSYQFRQVMEALFK
jgi:F0F1-type ATP synthase delta subunit